MSASRTGTQGAWLYAALVGATLHLVGCAAQTDVHDTGLASSGGSKASGGNAAGGAPLSGGSGGATSSTGGNTTGGNTTGGETSASGGSGPSGGSSGGGTAGMASSSGGASSFECEEGTAQSLAMSTPSLPMNACAKIEFDSDDQWIQKVTLMPDAGVYPIAFQWLNCNASGSGVLSANLQHYEIFVDTSCSLLVALAGSSASFSLSWWGS